jgi:hypothetical protein
MHIHYKRLDPCEQQTTDGRSIFVRGVTGLTVSTLARRLLQVHRKSLVVVGHEVEHELDCESKLIESTYI